VEDYILLRGEFRVSNLAKKMSTALATFVLIPANVSGNLISTNEVNISKPLTNVTINTESDILNLRVSAKNVKEALEQANIFVDEYDKIEPNLEIKLDGSPLTINVVKALPVLIMDENAPIKTFSGFDKAEEILKQHNIEFDLEDSIDQSLITDFAVYGWLGQKVEIKRAPEVNIFVDNTVLKAKSWKNTVKEVLEEKKIIVGDKDKVIPSLEAIVTNGLDIEIVRVAESVVKKETSVLRRTEYQDDYDLLKGQQEIIDEGFDGLTEQIFKVTFENGKIANEVLISEKVLKAPSPRVIKRGQRPHNPNDYWPTILEAAKKYGVDPAGMYCVMLKESGGRYDANFGNGLYIGLFQWENNSWPIYAAKAGFPGADRYNTTAQIYATAYRIAYGGTGWIPWPNTSRACGLR